MKFLMSDQPDFARAFDKLVDERRTSADDVADRVGAILADVRSRGEAAIVDYTSRFDRHTLSRDGDWAIPAEQCKAAYDALDATLRDALDLAARRITTYHEQQIPADRDHREDGGIRTGARWRAVEAAGLYVPGGRASYPSSLLMNAIPARVAGVKRLAVVTPTPGGEANPLVLAAAHIAGVDEIWRIGGAQAIAALAYGTDRIAPVDVVVGPGNAYVAEAKRQLFGTVGIDMVAGPSEILVIADAENDPDWIAADLLSQAEHDPTAQSILITDSKDFAGQVEDRVDVQSSQLPTRKVARESWDAHGTIIVVDRLSDAVPLANRLAPEHLLLAVDDPDAMFARIENAGSVFLGRHTPEAIGDYVAGPNHVLPTGRRARFASGLSVLDFMKRTSFIALDREGLEALGPAAIALAEAEGLPAHARSIQTRLA